jgi:phenylacetate-coenzyme A ligase PaaK-like adenylate-forming protein
LYRSLGTQSPRHAHTSDDLRAAAETLDDPFGGRHDENHPPAVVVQVARDQRIYWALGAGDLSRMARLMARTWSEIGIRAGESIALYDYATSPTVLCASRSYVPHLDAGAADILGCLPICNDGLPELADRCVHIFEHVRPAAAFVDIEAVDPLLRAVARRSDANRPARVIITGDEAVVGPGRLRELSEALGTEVTQMLRADGPMLLAPPCAAEPMTFHPDPSHYLVEVTSRDGSVGAARPGGRITVSNLALASSVVVRYVTNLVGRVGNGACRCGNAGPKVVIDDDG